MVCFAAWRSGAVATANGILTASSPLLRLRCSARLLHIRAGLTLSRLDRVRKSCLVNRVRFGHRVVLRFRDRAPCAALPPPEAPHNWARRCRGRQPDAFSAANDVSVNASFVVDVQSNERWRTGIIVRHDEVMRFNRKWCTVRLMNVRDKVAVVTSASAGIGLAAARLIANKGAKLALAGTQELSQGSCRAPLLRSPT